MKSSFVAYFYPEGATQGLIKMKRIKLEEMKEGYNRTISILVEKLGENG